MASTMGEGVLDKNPKPPIFVIDGLDVGIFASIEDAVLQLEASDIKRGEYATYDAHGRLLELTVDGERILAHLSEHEPDHAEELSEALREFLKAMGVSSAADPNCDLPCLVRESSRFVYSPPRFWPFRKRK